MKSLPVILVFSILALTVGFYFGDQRGSISSNDERKLERQIGEVIQINAIHANIKEEGEGIITRVRIVDGDIIRDENREFVREDPILVKFMREVPVRSPERIIDTNNK